MSKRVAHVSTGPAGTSYAPATVRVLEPGGYNMDWNFNPGQQNYPGQASQEWVERVSGAEMQLAQQNGDRFSFFDALAKLFTWRIQNGRG